MPDSATPDYGATATVRAIGRSTLHWPKSLPASKIGSRVYSSLFRERFPKGISRELRRTIQMHADEFQKHFPIGRNGSMSSGVHVVADGMEDRFSCRRHGVSSEPLLPDKTIY